MMQHYDDEKDDPKQSLAIDWYKIKLDIPRDLGEEIPLQWRDVAKQMHRHLMRICAGTTRFLAETIESATRLVRGIGKLPESVNRRLGTAHEMADRQMSLRRALRKRNLVAPDVMVDPIKRLEEDPIGTSVAQIAVERIEEILERYRVSGYVAELFQMTNGQIVMVIGATHGTHTAIIGALEPSGNDKPEPPGYLGKTMD